MPPRFATRRSRAGIAMLVSTLACLSSGCIATGQYTFLAARAPGAVVEQGYDDYHVVTVGRTAEQIRLALPAGGTVVVRACNRDETSAITIGPIFPVVPWPPSVLLALWSHPTPPLLVSLGFSGAGLSIDPDQVRVDIGRGAPITPTRIAWVPHMGMCVPEPGEPLQSAPIQLSTPSTVVLRFDVDAIPRQFTLSVGGISEGDAPVSLPPVQIRRGREWILYPFNS